MNILYLSCHSILEFDETKLFTELGHNVFSVNGSYSNPANPIDNKRPSVPNAYYNEQLIATALQCSKENLHPELIEWADVIMVMSRSDWIISNWSKMKHKKVVWRTIGQSTPDIESQMVIPRMEGLQIVRYSPAEQRIPYYAGHDAIIRFYKDESEYSCWHGTVPAILNVSQAMKKRTDNMGREYCNFTLFDQVTKGFPRVLYGPNNEDTGISGGCLSYEELKDAYRKHRVYFYTGTYPASYTLNFIEAMMTGIPVVAIGSRLANLNIFKGMDAYEVPEIIQHGINGYCSDDSEELRGNLDYMLSNPQKAKEIGLAGRETAMKLFGRDVIFKLWRDYLCGLATS